MIFVECIDGLFVGGVVDCGEGFFCVFDGFCECDGGECVGIEGFECL